MVRWGALDDTAAVLLVMIKVRVRVIRFRVRVRVRVRVKVRVIKIMFGVKMLATRRIFDLLLCVNLW